MVEDTWRSVALPLMEYIHEHGGMLTVLSVEQLSSGTGLEPLVVAEEIDRLAEAGYLAGGLQKTMTGGDPRPWFLKRAALAEKGLRVVGAWPSEDPYDALIETLDRRIAAASDEPTKGRLQALRTSVAEVGKATIAGLIVELTKGTIHF